jgi:hypothetical protein
VLSSPQIQATTRSRSSSKVSNKDSTYANPGSQSSHGNKGVKDTDNADRAPVTTAKDAMPKMLANKHADIGHPLPSRTTRPSAQAADNLTTHSNSVPSTPHQHARKFSFESRDPSPNAAQSHSPRSVYSETNTVPPSVRPLRLKKCRYETSSLQIRRRFNYTEGCDRLERRDLGEIKSRLTEDEERKLTTDMRKFYDQLLPTKDSEKRRQKLVQKLEKLFNHEWPGHNIRVHLFGSSGNLLYSDDSDGSSCQNRRDSLGDAADWC